MYYKIEFQIYKYEVKIILIQYIQIISNKHF